MTRLIRLPLLGLQAVAALLVVASGPVAEAHDGHEHEDPKAAHLAKNQRTWTDASGSFHVHGSFVSTREGQVQIRKEDGSLLDLTTRCAKPHRSRLDLRTSCRDSPVEQQGRSAACAAASR